MRFACWTAKVCATVICSKTWDRLKEAPGAVKQRYYCCCCCQRYKTKHGTMVQVTSQEGTSYSRATVPPTDNEDVRALFLEEELDPDSPEDLFARLPHCTPVQGDMLRQALPSEIGNGTGDTTGVYRILPAALPGFLATPMFQWEQMFTMFTAQQ